MSVKAARQLVTRAMRVAVEETTASIGRRSKADVDRHSLEEAGKVSGQFGRKLHLRLDAYTGSVDEFGGPCNTVDSWRLQFSRQERGLKAANDAPSNRKG